MNSDSIKEIYSKLIKDKKTAAILIIGIIGILLIMMSGTEKKEKQQTVSCDEMKIMSEKELSESLGKLIESIRGAGRSEVMITFSRYRETVYAGNTEERISVNGDKDVSEEYIIIDSDEGETGLRLKILSPEIRGVAVVCEGADNPVVKEQIISVVSALFDISSNKISVAVMA